MQVNQLFKIRDKLSHNCNFISHKRISVQITRKLDIIQYNSDRQNKTEKISNTESTCIYNYTNII